MHTDQTKIALIPAYNPVRKMLDVLRELTACGFFTVLVDDGSDEEEAEDIINLKPDNVDGELIECVYQNEIGVYLRFQS